MTVVVYKWRAVAVVGGSRPPLVHQGELCLRLAAADRKQAVKVQVQGLCADVCQHVHA